jgi:trimethylamine--corrinoid protein Co-methyltransferase
MAPAEAAPVTGAKRGFAGSSRPWLTDRQLDLLHEASLKILEDPGLRIHSPEALELFRKAGASVSEGNRVRIPPALTGKALASAPRELTIYDRDGRPAMHLGGGECWFGTGSDCLHIYDLGSGQRRPAVLRDVVQAARLADALPNLDFLMSMFLPSDVPPEQYERRQLEALLEQSTKPIVFCGLSGDSTRQAVAMAAVVAGGEAELSRRPFLLNYINTPSALRHNEESVCRLLYAARRNLPSIYAPGNCRGSTAPMSVAGMMALGNAGQLGALVLSQLAREGSPFILNQPSVGALDMRWMRDLFVSPDKGPAGCELGRRYGLPVFASGGAGDAKLFDAQAAAEAALSLFAAVASGASLVQNVGYLDSALTGSLELMVLGDELIGWLRRYLREIEVSEESLGLERIREAGPDGDYLASEDTVRSLAEEWQPALFDRSSYETWAEGGGSRLESRANLRARQLIEEHRASALPAPVRAELARLAEGPA